MGDQLEQAQRAFIGYTVEKELGSGGMATVYLAHDRKHDRKVAIKILHAEIAAVLGAERFLQEIKVTAFLQHPHILVLIDSGVIGEDGGDLRHRPYYVMPFIDGESLRQRLDKERQLPVADAVRIATEVASALDYAHRHGVVHRDIKPENILLHDGSAIVADFGIALAVTQAGGERMTQSGISLGTPRYMSPEQAAGERALTGRSDIYSLGVVTYEMLAGAPPFSASTPQAVVAKIMTEEPPLLTTQRPNVPPHVEGAVSRALEKVPADRFGSAHEFVETLNEPAFGRFPTTAARLREKARGRQRLLSYALGALAVLAIAAAFRGFARPTETKRMVEYTLGLDSAEAIAPAEDWAGRLAITRDGSTIAYIGGPHRQVMIRHRDELHATAIPGSDGAETPFFSPDGQRVGFITSNIALKHVTLDGASPVVVTDSLVGSAGESWARDGSIYTDSQVTGLGILRVEDKPGATPRSFTQIDAARREIDHTQPEVLPNDKGVLFTIESAGKNGVRTFAVAVAAIPSGKYQVIVRDAMDGRYAAPGRLLYVSSQGTLMSVPFDQESMKIGGDPTPLIEGMRRGRGASSDLAVSEEGTLVYAPSAGAENELVWVTRDGKAQPLDSSWTGGHFEEPAISPD
ncbi:MAG TPA: serine/threonine-protein kinase, partial [Gemmatimonadaceae bacterium]